MVSGIQHESLAARISAFADRLGRFIENASGIFCVSLFAGLTAVMLLGVFFRYIMANPFEWTEELARFLNLGLGYLAINIALRKNEHIAIMLVVQGLPSPIAKTLGYLVDLLIAFFLIILTRQGYLMATRTMVTGSAMDISMFWPYLTVPIGAGLALFQLVLNLIRKVASGYEAPPPEA
jgi:TRAP-type C4-dicarboxylate transport system permease small subunit